MLRTFRDMPPPEGMGLLREMAVFALWGGMFAFMPSRSWNKKALLIFPVLISITNFVFCGLYSWMRKKSKDSTSWVESAFRSLMCLYFASGLLMLASSQLYAVTQSVTVMTPATIKLSQDWPRKSTAREVPARERISDRSATIEDHSSTTALNLELDVRRG
jgi:hypothetical protein